MMKRVTALAILLGFVGLWTAFAQSSASLTSVDKVAWWTRRAGAQPLGNATNFEVAAGVQGDESIAALRVLIRGDITKATIVLGEADAPFKDAVTPKLRVCTTTVPWVVVDGGAYADAPKADCSAASDLTRTKDDAGNGSWAGDVTQFLAGARSEVTLMVVPSPDPANPLATPNWIKFVGRVDAEGTPDVQPAPGPVTAPTVPSAKPSTPSARPSVAPTASPTAVTSAPPTTAATTAVAAEPPRRFQTATSKRQQKAWEKLFILIPLAVLAAVLYTYGTKYWAERAEGATA